jgi:hypothetical protein
MCQTLVTCARWRRATVALLAVALVAAAGACDRSHPAAPSAPAPPARVAGASDVHLAAVGDIACDPGSGSFHDGHGDSTRCRAEAVAALVVGAGYDAFVPLGDIQYESGEYDAFLGSYDRAFAPVKDITHPVPGNHEYETAGADGYYRYFGAAAGDPTRGYYSYDLGAWHVATLNSNCRAAGGCGRGSPQETWLQADLDADHAPCTIVAWHHPRFSSGEHGDQTGVQALYQAAYDHGVDIVLSGHDHDYERFAKLAPDGSPDPRGVRQFVVGTGGRNHYRSTFTHPGSEAGDDATFGVLELTLHRGSYDWRFVAEAGASFVDTGSEACNGG